MPYFSPIRSVSEIKAHRFRSRAETPRDHELVSSNLQSGFGQTGFARLLLGAAMTLIPLCTIVITNNGAKMVPGS